MLYFSYGSNMSSRRLLSRVPSAKFVTTALLSGHELYFHKIGQDGSAKCDAFETENNADAVRGVIFDMAAVHKSDLDRIEGLGKGYGKKAVELVTSSGEIFHAYTYYATLIDATIKPYHWYKHHVIIGAMEYGLVSMSINYGQPVRSTIPILSDTPLKWPSTRRVL
jgi:hypothetical protein